jgi:predicted 3-demethylubiquinone-9 3-methyltransferase (glyoxalase superfamily)/uncharacterized protein YndB with AHSA1/START domain
MQKITPFLWFDQQAEEAAGFYVSVFNNSRITGISRNGDQVMTVGFQLEGQAFTALNGGPVFKFSEAVSFVVHCATQREVDYFWEKLGAGGAESQCGWLRDKFGLSWQIVPDMLIELLAGSDAAKAQRVTGALMQMQKIDIDLLRRAALGAGNTTVTVEAVVAAPAEKVWHMWTEPAHIMQWNNASDDWHTPHAENDLRTGGAFLSRMAARDGSMSFDFSGTYDNVEQYRHIEYTIADGRRVWITFTASGDETIVTETFETENMHSAEMQRAGWQAILDNFKKHVETN